MVSSSLVVAVRGAAYNLHLSYISLSLIALMKYHCTSNSISLADSSPMCAMDPGYKLSWCLLMLFANGLKVMYSYLRSDFSIQGQFKVL